MERTGIAQGAEGLRHMGFSKRSTGAPDSVDREQGANLVEFAVLAPLLIFLVLGIVEFGWLFGQFNDIRHAAREGARYAAVNEGDETAIATVVCQAVEGFGGGLTSLDVDLTDGASGLKRDSASIVVTAGVGSLSNVPLITSFLPTSLSSDVSFRLEQDSTNWTTTGAPIDASALC